MHAKRHALLARLLIEANEGLEKASANCRLSVAQLQRFTDLKHRQFMPADVIADLEDACRRPIYSAAIARKSVAGVQAEDLVIEIQELTEDAAFLQRFARKASEDGDIDEVTEGPAIDRMIETLEQRLTDLRSARGRGRST